MPPIEKVAVIGAGVMGAGIAAHVANAGIPVVLLDIVPAGATNRNQLAERAVEAMRRADPAPLMHPDNARLITVGNLEDDLGLVAGCDWIVEAVVEKLEIKQALYRRLESVRKTGSIVSSNTSTIPLSLLAAGMPDSFRTDFLITHFFNPPRYMRLLEIVTGPDTRPDAVATIREFGDVALGKTIIPAKDTPGFIGNRIGVYWLQSAVTSAIERGLTVEEADSVVGEPMGIPKTGVFGLLDLVGLDLMPHVLGSLVTTLPKDDPLHRIVRDDTLVRRMVADGYTGRKGKGGFYRLHTQGGRRVRQAIDLETGTYRDRRPSELESVAAAKTDGLRALVSHPDRGGRHAWDVLAGTLTYAASLVPAIADDIVAVDEAMRLGYNWTAGPFELIDRLGAAWLAERLRADGREVPVLIEKVGDGTFYRVVDGRLQFFGVDGGYHDVVRPDGVLLLADIKRCSKPLARNGSASLWDIGDGVVCLEFHSKMNALDPDTMAMAARALEIVPERGKALVIYNEASNFSVGANIGLALFAANIALWNDVEMMVAGGQAIMKALRDAPFPVVAAPSGMALGGGCEILLHSDRVQAHAETYIGLVETGVGLVPSWGGCKEMLRRWSANTRAPRGPMPAVAKVFETVSTATVAKSALEARELGFLRLEDGITMNRNRLLADAKRVALSLVDGYVAPAPPTFTLPGPSGRAAMALAVAGFRNLGKVTPHDEVVAGHLADVLSGGETDVTETLSEDDVLALERRHFVALLRHPATIARIETMLETGKPLRN
jgi:3-hydroxyacyl-CoA dehydrogenase